MEANTVTNVTVEQIRLNHLRKQSSFKEKRGDFYEIAYSQLGLHSTDYWTPYLSVWARIGDYDAREVFESLNCGRKIVRINAFRNTVHVVHLENLPLIIRATGPSLFRQVRRIPFLRNLTDKQIESKIDEILQVLKEKPMKIRELKQKLPHFGKEIRWILIMASAMGRVVRASAKSAKSTSTAYSLLEKWVPGFSLPDIDEDKAISELILRYIATFGPVSLNDIAWWIPTTKTKVKGILQEFSNEIVEYEVIDKTLYAAASDLEFAGSLESLKEPVVWFLPYEDHLAKAFTDRFWYTDSEILPRLFPRSAQYHWPKGSTPKRAMPDTGTSGVNQSGEIRPSIWLDGQIVGRWEFGVKDEHYFVVYDLYADVPSKSKNIIEEKRQHLEKFVNNKLLPITKISRT